MKAHRIALFFGIALFLAALSSPALAAEPFTADPAATDVTVDISSTRAGVEPVDITVYTGQAITLNVTCVESFKLTGIIFRLDEYGIKKVIGVGKTATFTFVAGEPGEYLFTAGLWKGTFRVSPKP